MLLLRNLSTLALSGTLRQWSYRTHDSAEELLSPNYWADATSMLNIGDFIFVHHVGHGSAIYIVDPRGRVQQMCEWPPHRFPQEA